MTRREVPGQEVNEDDSDYDTGDLVRGIYFHEDRKNFSFMRTDWENVADEFAWSIRMQA